MGCIPSDPRSPDPPMELPLYTFTCLHSRISLILTKFLNEFISPLFAKEMIKNNILAWEWWPIEPNKTFWKRSKIIPRLTCSKASAVVVFSSSVHECKHVTNNQRSISVKSSWVEHLNSHDCNHIHTCMYKFLLVFWFCLLTRDLVANHC